MKFSRKLHTVTLAKVDNGKPDGTFTVKGYVSDCKLFAIHEQFWPLSGFGLSHLPTGYKVISARTRADAILLAKQIAPLLNWKLTSSWIGKNRKGIFTVNKKSKKVLAVIKVLEAYRSAA